MNQVDGEGRGGERVDSHIKKKKTGVLVGDLQRSRSMGVV